MYRLILLFITAFLLNSGSWAISSLEDISHIYGFWSKVNNFLQPKKGSGSFDSFGDEEINNFDVDSENSGSSSKKSKSKKDSALIKKFFPSDLVTHAVLSPNGEKIAYVKKGVIYISKVNGKQSFFSNTIGTKSSTILAVKFAGNDYIVYAKLDENNAIRLVSVNVNKKSSKDITPVEEVQSIQFFTGQGNNIMVVSNDGEKSLIHQVNVTSGKSTQKKEMDGKILNIFFSKNLNPILWVVEAEDGGDVYVRKNNESLQIDHTNRNDFYVAATSTHVYKLKKSSGNVIFCTLDLRNNNSSNLVIKNAAIRQCKVVTDADGNPMYIAILRPQSMAFIPITSKAKNLIQNINRAFHGYNWELMDIDMGGKILLFRVCNSITPDAFYALNMKTGKFVSKGPIISNYTALKGYQFNQTQWFTIPMSNGQTLSAGFTKCKKYSKNSPVVILLRNGEESTFTNNFYPLVQLLAQMGISVLFINQDCGKKTTEGQSLLERHLVATMNWLMASNLVVKRSHGIWAVQQDKIVIISLGNATFNVFKFYKKYQEKAFAGLFMLNPDRSISEGNDYFFEGIPLYKPLVILSYPNQGFQNIFGDAFMNGSGSYFECENLRPTTWVSLVLLFLFKVLNMHKIALKQQPEISSIVDGANIMGDGNGENEGDFGGNGDSSGNDFM